MSSGPIQEDISLNCSVHIPNFFSHSLLRRISCDHLFVGSRLESETKSLKSGGFLLGRRIKKMFTLLLAKSFKLEFSTKFSKTVPIKELTKTQSAKLLWTFAAFSFQSVLARDEWDRRIDVVQHHVCIWQFSLLVYANGGGLTVTRYPVNANGWGVGTYLVLPALRSYGSYQQRDRADHLLQVL